MGSPFVVVLASGSGEVFRRAWRYLTMLRMFPGFEERVMIVVTPAEVASRAATILVDMPPVPRAEPALETSTERLEMSETTSMAFAEGWVRGFLS